MRSTIASRILVVGDGCSLSGIAWWHLVVCCCGAPLSSAEWHCGHDDAVATGWNDDDDEETVIASPCCWNDDGDEETAIASPCCWNGGETAIASSVIDGGCGCGVYRKRSGDDSCYVQPVFCPRWRRHTLGVSFCCHRVAAERFDFDCVHARSPTCDAFD